MFFLSINVLKDSCQSLNVNGSPVNTVGSGAGSLLELMASASTLTKSRLFCAWGKGVALGAT